MGTAEMSQNSKEERLSIINNLLKEFCDKYLGEELYSCALNLSALLSRNEKLDITRGKVNVWAAAIIYVIARINYLFSKGNKEYLKPDIVCSYFDVAQSTITKRAAQIQILYNLDAGTEGYCKKEIVDLVAFLQYPGELFLPMSATGNRTFTVDALE